MSSEGPPFATEHAVGPARIWSLVFAWLLVHRFRVVWLQEQAEDLALDDALAARRAEAAPTEVVR